MTAAVVFSTLVSFAVPASAATAVRDGSAAASAAASCWEIKQDNASAPDGTYWLLTPAMDAPVQFYCDMTTDGGGWVLVGKGREGWTEANRGTGSQTALRTAGLSPMSGATSQLPATAIDGLLNNGRVDAQTDGIRLKRATNADGSAWQESRFNTNKGDRWVWTFGAEHQVAWYSFDGVRGGGGLTSKFGPDNAYRQINSSELSAQGYRIGFAYGSAVTGTTSSTSYLWSSKDGQGNAMPYTEMYLRPQVRSSDAGFTRTADTGTAVKTNVAVANSLALDSPWGVSGAKTPIKEGDVEVQAFAQSGNVMYVGGNFTSVQRSAAATGTDKVAQSFLAAFDVNTGELMRGFTPVLNAPVQALTTLPNGNIVAAGTFSQVNGAPATAIVALNPETGTTVPDWSVKVENRMTNGVLRVSSLSINGNWLYLGGAFTHLSGGSNPNSPVYAKGAARVAVGDGTPGTGWNPEFNGTVVAIDAADDGSRLYAAGYFTTSGTAPAVKAAAVQSSAGAALATPAWTPTFSNNNNYQQTIGQVGDRVWLGGSEHSFFSYSTSTFDLLSGNIGKNNGDFQAMSVSPTGVIYAGSHGHDWNYSNAFSWPNVGTGWTEADSFEWIGAWDAATGNIIPGFTPSMKFRLGQGVWATTVDSNGTMWTGGDMTTVATATSAGRWAGGFARFAQVDAVAPTTPSNLATSADGPSSVKLTWGGSSDASGTVSYQILRNDRVVATTYATSAVLPKGGENRYFVRAVDAAGNLSASTQVVTASGANLPPTAAFTATVTGLTGAFDASASTDDGSIADYAWDFGDGTTGSGRTVSHPYAAAGTYQVRLVVTDNGGEKSAVVHEASVVQPAPADPYGAAVYADSPSLYYRLDETAGNTAADASVFASPGTYSGTVTQGVPGALPGGTDTAAGFDGSSGLVSSQKSYDNPSTYSLELWFNTTTNRGGKLIGFGDQATGTSNNYDRHVYMQDDGKLVFGTWTGTGNIITTPAAYNDGKWHHMVATQSGAGMVLYLDGVQVGTNPQTGAQAYTGYWRIGGDTTWGSSSPYFAGSIDEAAVYPTALSAATVGGHYHLGGGNAVPVAAFTSTVTGLNAALDATGSTDDGTIAGYAWDFGDGATASGATVAHTYAATGTYQVKLTLTDDGGAKASLTRPVTIAPPAPTDAYGAAVFADNPTLYYRLGESSGKTAADSGPMGSPGTYSGGVNQGATGALAADSNTAASFDGNDGLVASGQSFNNPQTYSMEVWFNTTTTRGGKLIGFGNKATGLSNNYDRHIYMQDDGRLVFGTYTGNTNLITSSDTYNDGKWHQVLAAQSDQGMVLYVDGVQVGTNPQTGAQDYSGYWRIGGDNTWGSSSAYFAGTLDEAAVYPTAVTAARVAEHYRLATSVPAANQPPSASFTSAVHDLSVEVDASASADPDGSLASYAWDFGDGGTAQGMNAAHPYAVAGSYTVTLTVTDNQGATGVKATAVTVTAPPPVNQSPVATFTAAVQDQHVDVDAAGSADPDGSIAAYNWSFGDGATASGSTAAHDYAAAGSFDVTLTVTDNQGATAIKTEQIKVTAPAPVNQPPVATFTSTVQDLNVALDASASTDPDGTLAAYAWSFGDGGTATGATATHTYAVADTYTVTLTVTDNLGATGVTTSQVTVTAAAPANQAPQADFTSTVQDLGITVNGSGSKDPDGTVADWAWNFGDGGTASGATASHSYAVAGTFTVTLTVTDNKGATGVKTAPVTVTASASGPVDVLAVPAKSSWSWRYEATAPAADWKNPGFDASAWKTGSGVLGFGAAGLGTNIDVAGPTSNRPLTAYFLRQFTVDSAAKVQKLRLNTVADDGVLVYVNGTEVGRSNMPAGVVTFNSYAATAVNSTVAKANPVTIDVPVSLLKDGVNTIAVETHVNYRATRDLSFDLSATATVGDVPAPVENQAPVAKFSTSVNGLSLAADGSTSSDPDGTISSYAWGFGDGGTALGTTATHTYAAAGTYTVTLTVTDNKGATSVSTAPVTVAAPAGPVDIVVVPAKSSWSWRYSAGAPDAAWKNRGFDASSWQIGAGTLGFGSAGLGTNIDVPGAPSARPLAAYYVSQFNVDSAAQLAKLTLKTAADDGVVVYVNGTEVGRNNMPAGPATFGSYALSAIRSSAAAANPLTISVPTSLLVDGINTIAVETHVNYHATADMGFDLSAVATTK